MITGSNISDESFISDVSTWQTVLFIPFQYLVQVSCVLTLLLSVSRMIAVVKPLQVIFEKAVWASFSFFLVSFLGIAIGKCFALFKTEAPKSYLYTVYIETLETAIIVFMVVIVAVCSMVTVKSLKTPTIGEVPDVRQDGTHNRRATVMILILSLAFIIINGSWMTTLLVGNVKLFLATSKMSEEEISEYLDVNEFALVLFLSIAIIPINSIVNPLIYIARNTALNDYVKSILIKVLRARISGDQ